MDYTQIISAVIALISALVSAFLIPWLKTKIDADKLQTLRTYVEIGVKAAEQLYHDLGGPEKLKKAQEGVRQMLEEKGIPISELEMNLLIESAVAEFNYGLGGKKREAVPEEPPAGTSMTEDDRGASR